MKKRVISIVLALSLFAAPVAAGAASFSDLTEFHAWAETQIEEMTTHGIIKGYTDGTFRPDQAITKTEALVLTARAAGYIADGYSSFVIQAASRFNEAVTAYDTPYPNEVSYLLYKNILDVNELGSYLASDRANYSLSRSEMALLLTRLMRAEGDLEEPDEIVLSYADSADISYAYLPYVDYVTESGLMQGVYDPEYPDSVFFKPNEPVTRAQMAVLLYRVLEKMDITVEIYDLYGGIVQDNSLSYKTTSGALKVYTVTDSVNLIIDGWYCDSVEHVQSGAKVAFFKINGEIYDVEVLNDEAYRYDGSDSESSDPSLASGSVTGTISSISITENGVSVEIDGVFYDFSSSAVVYLNSVAATAYSLRVGQNVTLVLSSGLVLTADASDASISSPDAVTRTGVISAISYTNRTVDLTYEDANGDEVTKRFSVETNATIVRAIDGRELSFDDLEEDYSIVATGVVRSGTFYVSKIVVN
ncbi:MAG: S-layer homology domain-containing protein [Clostridia bacterium]|nr:S-layer homology domain-containing protein [Clostridia bacterium]